MRLLARGLQHLSRRIPANATFITRIHTSSFRYKDQPSSKSSTNVPADSSQGSSSLEHDENILRQYFYRLPDPVLDDVQVEDFDGELGPKTRILETRAPDIYPDEDIEELWARLQDKFTEEDFELLAEGDPATEERFNREVKKLWLTQGREEWEGLEPELEKKLQEEGADPVTPEEVMGYIDDLEGYNLDRASDVIPNLSPRYADLNAIDETSDELSIDRNDMRAALKVLDEAIPEELEKEGLDASHDKELIQKMLGEVDGMELSQIADVGGRDENEVPGGARSSAAGSLLSEGEGEGEQLQEYQLQFLRRSHQTGKGKMASWYCLTVVGNGNGLVGLGEGKSTQGEKARDYALSEAKRNMDYVDRFENRTLWTEMQGKFGGARLIMRPRPVGFGLMCAPGIHQVLKAAGIKDCSAKLWGSRNKIVSVKLAIKMLHAGHQPLYFGNGVGGRGIRLEKGKGMRNKTEVERERGRRIIDAQLR